MRAVQEQVAKLIHVPNTWYTEPQGEWAKLLSERSFGGQAFFCNSGTEANEAAIKLVRLRSDGKRYKIITFKGGFHGRTMGSVSATAQPKYHEGLGPMVAGFQYAPHGDLEAVEKLIDEHTGGILVEPILGEGGVVPAPAGFLQGLRRIADERDLLLVFDEVQCGCGRTGKWFGYQHFGVTPDVITLAKSLCAGMAGGAMLTTTDLAEAPPPRHARGHVRRQPRGRGRGRGSDPHDRRRGALGHVDRELDADHHPDHADVADGVAPVLEGGEPLAEGLGRPVDVARAAPAPRSSRIAAMPAAAATGLPPNVAACMPGRRCLASSAVVSMAPPAMPAQRLLASVITSGVTPKCW